MNIAIDALLVSGAFSGVQQTILAQTRALLELDSAHQFTVVALQDVPIEEHIGVTRNSCAVIRAPLCSGKRLQRLCWEQFSMPRVLEEHGIDLLYSPGYLTSLRWARPSVVFMHDTIALSHPHLCTMSNALNYRLLLPASARHATLVVTPSTVSAEDTTRFCHVAPERIRIVTSGVQTPAMPTAAEITQLRQKLGIAAPFLLAVSTIEPKKNFASLIRWFSAWKASGIPHHLVIAGKWGWGCGEVRRALARSRDHAQIHLTGYLDREELVTTMAAAELLLMPSLYEGFGLPVLEAMAVGTPVVVSDRGALPETVGNAGLVIPLEDALWQAEIPTLLRYPARLATMRVAGHAHAAAHSWRRSAEHLLTVFEEAAGAISPSSPNLSPR